MDANLIIKLVWYHDYVSEYKGHGRIERREVSTGKCSTETKFYLTSIKAEEAQRIGESIRGHWSIENQLH